MASPSELSLECKPHHSYSLLLKPAGEQNDQLLRLEEFLAGLEEERLKIEAFKRELPLCMQLLTNAVETSRQQLQTYRGNQGPRPVLEEFIPLKNPATDSEKSSASNVSDNKSTWMNTAQLWSRATETKESDMGYGTNVNNSKLGPDVKQKNSGAFISFLKDKNRCPSTLSGLPDLALASGEQEGEDRKCLGVDNVHNGANNSSDGTVNGLSCGRGESFVKGGNGVTIIEQGKGGELGNEATAVASVSGAPQMHRKARRCWSPDLHRRFVNALQILGGSQAATPKQIRELMKVDGLTNDEVKSHLQKYRLHTRRPSPSPQATGTPPPPQLVVLGGIWVPPEYAAAAHHGPPTLYSTHPTPHHPGTHFQVPPEFYHPPPPPMVGPPPLPPRQLHLHHQHHHSHDISPEPDAGGGNGDRSESIEDGKSESGIWKADSNGGGGGEHGAERKGGSGLLTKEENEESNGSEITLKF